MGEGGNYGMSLHYVYFQQVPYPIYFFISPIILSTILRVSTIQSLKVLCLHRSRQF